MIFKIIAFTAAAIPIFLFVRSIFFRRTTRINEGLREFKKQANLAVSIFLFLIVCIVVFAAGKLAWTCSRQVPSRRPNQLAPEIVSVSSEGLCLYCQHKNSLLGWLGRQREPRLPHGLVQSRPQGFNCASAHSS